MAGVEGGVQQGPGQVAVDVGVEVQGGVRGLLREELLGGGEGGRGQAAHVLLAGVTLARVWNLLGLDPQNTQHRARYMRKRSSTNSRVRFYDSVCIMYILLHLFL